MIQLVHVSISDLQCWARDFLYYAKTWLSQPHTVALDSPIHRRTSVISDSQM
jgi:hypothetical protein